MNITNITIKKTIEVRIGPASTEEEILVNVDYYGGRSNRNSGEMLRMNGRLVRAPALEPDDPAELDICTVEPADDTVKWSQGMKEAIFDSLDTDDLWADVEDYMTAERDWKGDMMPSWAA
jgi:hypothetical protein